MQQIARTPTRDAPLPHGRTARRLEWSLLPPALRALVERRIGSPVACAASAGSGFTPGFASVLHCEDDSRHFVKAASKKAQRPFADAYREEIRKLRALPAGLPVPRLLWSHEDELWVVLELEYVEGRVPARPWKVPELITALDALEVLADRLTPPPLRLRRSPTTSPATSAAGATSAGHTPTAPISKTQQTWRPASVKRRPAARWCTATSATTTCC